MKEYKKILFLNHDVNNHLFIALGYFELLLEKTPDLQENPYASYILKALLRTRDLSFELAQACKEDGDNISGLSENDFKKISVQEHFLRNAKPAYEKLREQHDLEIKLKITEIDEEKFSYLNPAALLRLRENIVSNAINAGATKLDVHLEMKEYCVIVSFKDNGMGMTQEELDKVILSQHGDGKVHGVGTRIILETAKEHSYSITYSSEKGKGTTIRVLVPYCEKS